MTQTLSIAPPNSIIFIADASGGLVPEFIATSPILSTESMISVGCLANVDGNTTITLGGVAEVGVAETPAFDGILVTPTGQLFVSTVEEEGILSAIVPMPKTRIRVWTNRAAEPDNIIIGWGD